MTRPLPWHDTPKCRDPKCGGPIVLDDELGCAPMCGACGALFKNATPAEKEQIRKAEAAWDAVMRGEAHEDKACARCGGLLPIEQSRLCQPCVVTETAGRNLSLFPESP